METKSDSVRLAYPDALRIFATVSVIILHCIPQFILMTELFGTRTWWACNILNSIARTGVPIFFMLSGFLLLDHPGTAEIKPFYQKRFLKILIPFLVWNILYFLYYGIVQGNPLNIGAFFSQILANGTAYHFWYIYMLSGIYLFMPFLKRIVDRCTPKQLLWLLIVIIFPGTIRSFLNTVTPVYIFLFDPIVESYIGYVLLGYLLGKIELTKKIRVILYCGGAAGFLYGTVGHYILSSPAEIKLAFNGGYGINHYLLAAAFFVFAKYHLKIKNSRVVSLLSALSGITYGVYFIHAMIIHYLQQKTAIASLTPAQNIALTFTLTVIVSFGVMYIFSKNKIIKKLFM